MALLAASGGDTVKLFDVSDQSGNACTLSYAPSPGYIVNSVKWNHTNLVVASAGEDKKISFWRINGQSIGTLLVPTADTGDNVEEDVLCINFSNKGSRYLCSGGSGQVVRIWDLQRKRCIKRLKGHTSTITGAMYNCKDEHLASISLSGDLILHNLASSAKVTELRDPNKQVLRVLDYSRVSRHLLVTAGDDGSIHLWDTTSRSPKVSWSKQHSAPIAGVSFSPINDKIIASVGLDKKLYIFDSGMKKDSFSISYEAPFSSLAFRDDGWILAAGTSSGRVVFYDVRGKRHPFSVLSAFANSEVYQAVTSLCWQRSKAVVVNESNCSDDAALFGGAFEDSVLMPDPLPSAASLSLSQSAAVSGPRNTGRSSYSTESLSLGATTSGCSPSTHNVSNSEETPHRSMQWAGGALGKLHLQRNYNFKDDMDVFSPLVDVQPVTPSLDKLWHNFDGAKRDQPVEKAPSLLSKMGVHQPGEDGDSSHPIFDWKSGFVPKDASFSFVQLDTAPSSSKRDDSSGIIHEAWGERSSENSSHQPIGNFPSHFSMSPSTGTTSTSVLNAVPDLSSTSQMSLGSMTTLGIDSATFPAKEIYSSPEISAGILGHIPFSSLSLPHSTKPFSSHTNLESTLASMTLNRKPSTYAERISTTSFRDGTSTAAGSQKTKKTGIETNEEPLTAFSRSDISSAVAPGLLSSTDLFSLQGTLSPKQKPSQPDIQQQGTPSFQIKLFQRIVEETFSSFQKSIHEDVRNLHIEVLRQFHMHEMEMSSALNSILDNQAELLKEIQALRKENLELRQLLR